MQPIVLCCAVLCWRELQAAITSRLLLVHYTPSQRSLPLTHTWQHRTVAYCSDAEPRMLAAQHIEQRYDQAAAAGANWVPDCDRASKHIHPALEPQHQC